MKPLLFPHINLFIIFFGISCTEQPINSQVDSSLIIDTHLIENFNITSYSVPPSLGTNERLYLGEKNGIQIPFSFIKFGSSSFWNYYTDSTKNIDSVQFKLSFYDSSQSSSVEALQLYFSPDSHFNENTSTFLDFDGFSFNEWHQIGGPDDVLHKTDTSNAYTYSELVWDIDSLMYLLSDSGITRTFAIKFMSNDSNFIEIYSEEATTGERDPKVTLFYNELNSTLTDTTTLDTFYSIFSSADLSIFDPTGFQDPENYVGISNGIGKRVHLTFPFSSDTLRKGSIIKSANLTIPIYSSSFSDQFNIIINPILNDSIINLDTTNFFIEDPFEGVGYPYRLSSTPDSSEYIISVKNILQSFILGNKNNIGFKILSEEKNNPFQSIKFLLNDSLKIPKIEIIYVYNEN